MSDKSSSSSEITTTGLLGVLFIALKLTGVIDWSWWWVTSPFWFPAAFVLVVVLPVYIVANRIKKREAKYFVNDQGQLSKKSKFQQRLDEAMEQAKSKR